MIKSFLIIFLAMGFNIFGFSQDIRKGQQIYNNLCVLCHAINVDKIGLSLANIKNKRTDEWLTNFIKNPAEFAKIDSSVASIIKEHNGIVMPFTNFKEVEIIDLLAYITSID